MYSRLQNCLCFPQNLTLATRLIAFIGIATSVLLVTVLLNDFSNGNFNISRNVALALGLDWRHIHPQASTSIDVDPEGRNISILMIVYAFLFFLTNILLLLGAIIENSHLALPWLIYECLSYISKIAAFIFHLVTEIENLNKIFIVGSVIYLVIMFWWWLIVFITQHTWKAINRSFQLSSLKNDTIEFDSIILNSPEPYRANRLYTSI